MNAYEVIPRGQKKKIPLPPSGHEGLRRTQIILKHIKDQCQKLPLRVSAKRTRRVFFIFAFKKIASSNDSIGQAL
ncbi:MAG: hypothetical protein HOJ03_12945 [Nitrospina sp.]|jgi:hypothetical protein|nr:hypothetical protein [Nitrospina sp.]MBT7680878.1 hypothetical protein [Nitrospina sp.]